jgi:hypothetical protein
MKKIIDKRKFFKESNHLYEGWWDRSIMGGDLPLDIVAKFEKIAEVDDFSLTANDINKNINKMIKVIERLPDKNIGWQVLGFLIMQNRAEMPFKVKQNILNACLNDNWANEGDYQRKKVIEDFMYDIKKY